MKIETEVMKKKLNKLKAISQLMSNKDMIKAIEFTELFITEMEEDYTNGLQC